MTWTLHCISGDAVPKRVILDGPLDLGRDPHCDVRVLDDSSSRFHARLEPTPSSVNLVDNKSSNGTWVDGKRIAQITLKSNQLFTIGSACFAVIDDDQQGVTRVLTDDGLPLHITAHTDTSLEQRKELSQANQTQVHQALQALVRCEAIKRPEALALLAANMCQAKKAAVIRYNRVSTPTSYRMSERLAARLAAGNDARLLEIGKDLSGKTIASEAIGSAATAYLGPQSWLLVATDIEAPALTEQQLATVALLAAEAGPLLAPDVTEVSHPLIGNSPLMDTLRQRIKRVAAAETTVLITGASGTGKEVVARQLHELSGRNQGPFVAVNCGAISENLIEAELFGHEKGAFTGAEKARAGRFRAADGGMLFLDEIGELPLPAQATLLRALQEGVVEPVGSTDWIAVDVRVCAATNRDLSAEVQAGRFREDLFYRLDVIRIRTPSLQEHADDIPDIARHLLEQASEETGLPIPALEHDFLDGITTMDWPGNVRQLRNALTRALVMAEDRLGLAHLERAPATTAAQIHVDADHFPTLAELEAQHVAAALQACSWNKSEAARMLGISRPTLHKKIKDYQLQP